ncbi:MAG: hypothetical protein HYU86_06415 [Chloroflexi bacterium]|nr:hypothetical protein [Chloroflexota bacterium]
MRQWKWVLDVTLALMVGLLLTPGAVEAHDGAGFHPEALGDLLRTVLLAAAAIALSMGVLWFYERMKSRLAK